MIDTKLKALLILFSCFLIILTLNLVRKGKLPIKYSLVWLSAAGLILLVGIIPEKIGILTNLFGFRASVNFIIGILLVLLMLITLALTLIVSKQKKTIILLIQKIALLERMTWENEGRK